MNRDLKFLLTLCIPAILIAVGCPGPGPGPGPTPPPTPPPAKGYDCGSGAELSGLVSVEDATPGRYIVVLKRQSGVRRLSSDVNAFAVNVVGVRNVQVLGRTGFSAEITASGVQALLDNPQVQYVQEDGVKTINEVPWNLDRSDQRDLPLDDVYAPGSRGDNVHVAIIDTGVTDVPDFEERLSDECFTAHSPGGCNDLHGHGTHVAGTVGGQAWGIAKDVTLYAVRVLNAQGSGSDSDVIRGIEWVTARKNRNPSEQWASNMSLGGSPSPALDDAVCRSIEAGVVHVVAAGNEGEDAENSSPARVNQAITVGAMDRNDRVAFFSNHGSLVDVFAPGVNVTSDSPSGGTAIMNGTSMASPAVAGGAALVLARNNGMSPAEVSETLVDSASKDKLSGLDSESRNLLLYVKSE